MSYWSQPIKQIKVDLQIIGSPHRKADDPDSLAVWSYVQDMLISLHGLEEALKSKDEMNGHQHPETG